MEHDQVGEQRMKISQECQYYSHLTRPIVVCLDGMWRFKLDKDDRGEKERWFESGVLDRETVVPSSWQAVFDDLRDYCGTGWYERNFTVPKECEGQRIIVVFSGVDYFSKIWINGKPPDILAR